MALTAGTISVISKTSNTAQLNVTPATGGTGPYTNQWYRDTSNGFSPGAGNIIAGATELTLNDTGLIPGTTYYYKVVQTDTGHSNDQVTATQATLTTDNPGVQINSFDEQPFLGMLDLKVGPTNVVAALIDLTQATALYGGSAVKLVDSADGAPKVVGCAADSDEVFGFIVYDIKSKAYNAGDRCEIAQGGSCMWLYASAAIARGVQVVPNLSSSLGTVQDSSGQTGANKCGWAYDKATAYGQLIRVMLTCPSYQFV
jgi:hypothetical protein